MDRCVPTVPATPVRLDSERNRAMFVAALDVLNSSSSSTGNRACNSNCLFQTLFDLAATTALIWSHQFWPDEGYNRSTS